MKNIFIKTYKEQWNAPTSVLRKKLKFSILSLNCKPYPAIPNWRKLFLYELSYIVALIKNFKRINNAHVIICPNYLAIFLLLLKKLKVLKADKLCWFGMFIHNPKILRAVGKIVKLLFPGDKSFYVIVFSSGEVDIYAKKWNIPRENFIYIPYGDWSDETLYLESTKIGDYYFSGGYSNRDYPSLIEIFKNTKYKLVIVASKKNTDLVEYERNNIIPSNIRIFYDLGKDEFNKYLVNSKAVIFHMKYNTGASGQMVALNSMRNKKLIISSYTDVLDDYFKNMEGALIYQKKNAKIELPQILYQVDSNIQQFEQIIDKAFSDYIDKFSFEGLSKILINQVSELI